MTDLEKEALDVLNKIYHAIDASPYAVSVVAPFREKLLAARFTEPTEENWGRVIKRLESCTEANVGLFRAFKVSILCNLYDSGDRSLTLYREMQEISVKEAKKVLEEEP